MKKICIIEDDRGISASLKLYLENSDFEVSVYETGFGADEFIKQQNPHLVILDINLPVKNGMEVCSELRKFSQVPIIMLTARAWEWDKIKWLEVWADDYISKPFSPRELLARIKWLLRRVWEISSEEVFIHKDITLYPLTAEIIKNNQEVSLTKNEFDIFYLILQSPWKLVTREVLMRDAIWYENYAYDRTIDTHIKNIRKKLDLKEDLITVRGKGYKLIS